MKCIIYILIFLFTKNIISQSNNSYKSGQLYNVLIKTIDKKTKKSIKFVTVTGALSNRIIIIGTSNLDGEIQFKICSNKLINDSLTIIASVNEYKFKSEKYKIQSDTIICLFMKNDKKIKEAKEVWCGTGDYDIKNDSNAVYRHCDGRKMKFKQLVESNEKIGEWEKINKN